MRIIVTGANGQLGQSLISKCPKSIELIALARADLDITIAEHVNAIVARIQPHWIINAAAYTAVDKAESEPEAARAINETGVANLATAARRNSARLLHISTDFVFDGEASRPYRPTDATNPLNIYGRTKLAGEQAATRLTENNAVIVRTAWVYNATGRNFLTTMCRLMTERQSLSVVGDQRGTPTSADDLAAALWNMALQDAAGGIYHYTNHGEASWYDFACAIRERLAAIRPHVQLASISTTDTAGYPTPARRPKYSVLDCSKSDAIIGPSQDWRQALDNVMSSLGPTNQ